MSLYLATIRKTISAFGTIFDNISLNRFAEAGGVGDIIKTIKVPLSYAPADKFIRILSETVRDGSAVRLKHTLPRMSFEMVGLNYDSSRKLQTMNGMCPIKVTTSDDIAQFFRQMNPVPYNYDFRLHIAAKKTEDIFQIVEQIFPHFAPSYNLTIKDVESLGITRDVPVIIESIETTDNYDGAFTENRVIVWTLNFKVQGYIYPPITDSAVIKKVETTIFNASKTGAMKQATVTVSVEPFEADYDEDWSVSTVIEEVSTD